MRTCIHWSAQKEKKKLQSFLVFQIGSAMAHKISKLRTIYDLSLKRHLELQDAHSIFNVSSLESQVGMNASLIPLTHINKWAEGTWSQFLVPLTQHV